MSDLNLVDSQPAKVGDRLVTTDFAKPGTRGFAAVGKLDVAVCLVPGTELAFEKDIRYHHRFSSLRFCISHKIARFRRFNMDGPSAGHDALELADGRIVMLAELAAGQTATVMQIPPSAQPAPAAVTASAFCAPTTVLSRPRPGKRMGARSFENWRLGSWRPW